MDLLKEYVGMIMPTTITEILKLDRHPHTFKVKIDYGRLNELIKRGESQTRVRFGTVKPIPHEQYIADLAKMKEDVIKLNEDMTFFEQIIDRAPRKKDGTFINGRVLYRIPYRNTAILHRRGYSSENFWSCYALKVRTVHDTELWVSFEQDGVG